MPAQKKSTSRAKASSVKAAKVTSQQTVSDISYETKLTIVVLLLLFVYPLGLIFMWFWMKNWPLWLKILISLPVALGILAIFVAIFAIAMIVKHVATDKNFQYQMRHDQDNYQYEYQMSPAPSDTMTPSDITPTPIDNGTVNY